MPTDEQIDKLAAYLNVSPEYLLSGSEISPEHLARCQKLFALSTRLSARDVESFLQLAESILATKV